MPTNTTEPQFSKEPDGSFSTATLKAIEQELYKLTDEYSIETYPAEHRNHLGVSVIGDNCSAKLWYAFRWVKLEQHEPRMRRLFNRGHEEEIRFKELLSWMGFFVREIDPATNKQYKLSKLNGHYGGSSDTLALLPWFRKDDKDCILVEYKTHNIKSFNKLKDKKLKIAKPLHFAQMSGYGREFKTKYGLYCAVCKDTDEIYYEFVELDWQYAYQLENKASDIISSKIRPPRISENPAWFDCNYCHFKGICHYGEAVEVNCRSCKMATPSENGQWHCSRFNSVIPNEFVKKGCPDHVSINS